MHEKIEIGSWDIHTLRDRAENTRVLRTALPDSIVNFLPMLSQDLGRTANFDHELDFITNHYR